MSSLFLFAGGGDSGDIFVMFFPFFSFLWFCCLFDLLFVK